MVSKETCTLAYGKSNEIQSHIGDFHAVTVLALHVAIEGVISIEMNSKAVPPIKEG